jgi:hypothetical protein
MVRLLALAGMLLVLWIAFSAQEASAEPAPEFPGSAGAPAPDSASTVRVLTPVTAAARGTIRPVAAPLVTIVPARGATPQQPGKASAEATDSEAKEAVPPSSSASPETSRRVRPAASARGTVDHATAATTREVQWAGGAVDGLLAGVGTAGSHAGLETVTEPVVSAARPVAAAVVAGAIRPVTGVADTVASAPLPVLDVPLAPDGERFDQIPLLPSTQTPGPAVPSPGLGGEAAAGPLVRDSTPLDNDASTHEGRSGDLAGAAGPQATGWTQDIRPPASSGPGAATSMSGHGHRPFPGGPGSPGLPGSPGALGTSAAAGAGSSASGGGGPAADTVDAIGLPSLLTSLVSPDQRENFSHRQPLPAFSPE